MRVLQVINSLDLGGAEVLVMELSSYLCSRGVDVRVLALRSTPSRLERALSSQGVPVHSDPTDCLYSVAHLKPLIAELKACDLAHAHLFPTQLWVATVSRLSGSRVPLVTTEHNTYNRRRKHRLFKATDAWVYSRYDAIACISEATAVCLREWLPRTAGKIRIIPNGVLLDKFANASPAALPANVSPGDRIAMSVARFDPQKDHATLLRAVAKVRGLQLLLVGDGPLRPGLRQLSSELGLSGRVHFLGKRDDVAGLLKTVDIFVHSTNYDGFGIAVVEAMAAGVPVVVSNVPGLASVVADAGVTFSPGSCDELASALSALLASEERRRELACAATQRAKAFSIEKTANAYLQLYRELLAICAPARQ